MLSSGIEIISLGKYFRGISVRAGERELPADFVFLPMTDFDVILGMGWLTQNYACVHCREKKITIAKPGEPELIIKGIKQKDGRMIVSALKAHKMLQKGCTAYLASVVKAESSQTRLEDLDVVKVFPDDLPPPHREIEFTVDLMPGTSAISKAPYRMAPAEL